MIAPVAPADLALTQPIDILELIAEDGEHPLGTVRRPPRDEAAVVLGQRLRREHTASLAPPARDRKHERSHAAGVRSPRRRAGPACRMMGR